MILGADMQVKYRYLIEDRDRHGNVRIYFRFPGFKKIRIRETPGTVAFSTRYDDLRKQFESGASPEIEALPVKPVAGTLGWLTTLYRASSAFKDLDATTQQTRTRVMESMLEELVNPAEKAVYRLFPVNRMDLHALEVLRDRKKSLPGAATDRVKALRALFKWAKTEKHCAIDPSLGLKKPRIVSDGHHTWTPDEVAQFEKRHPLGTKAHLALMIFLFTGARRSDAHRLGRQHIQGDSLRWTAFKNRNRYPTIIHIPLLAPLAQAIAAAPTGDMVFLVTEYGKPFTRFGLGNWFKDRCREAGLARCSGHGLRKAGSSRAAEAGATAHQLMSMFGWRSLAEAEIYTKAAERKRMAAAGMQCLLAGVGPTSEVGQ